MNKTLDRVLRFFGILMTNDGIIIPMTMVSTLLCKIAMKQGHFVKYNKNTYKVKE